MSISLRISKAYGFGRKARDSAKMPARRMAEDGKQGPLRLGDRFLKYVIQDRIGRGGHAWVYHGRDEFLDNDVAIKILHREGGVTPDMLRRGRAEAKLLFRLKHRNIVEILDAGITDEGLLYIVMELLHGRTHRELVRTRRLAIAETLELFAGITDGVEAAHRVNAIHRDLKPENVFVLEDNTPKILDFGIAKVVGSAGFTTERDVLHGTMLYMAPERLQGHEATACSDVYSLGLMLFETLYGRHPCLLKNTSPTMDELAWIQTAAVPPPLNELDPSIPRYVARAVDRAIAKIPSERIASMAAFGEAIRECSARFSEDVRTDRMSRPISSGAPPGVRNDTMRMPRQELDECAADRTAREPAPHTAPPTTTSLHGARGGVVLETTRHRRSLRRMIALGAVAGGVAGGAIAVWLTTPSTASSTTPSSPVEAPARHAANAAATPEHAEAFVQAPPATPSSNAAAAGLGADGLDPSAPPAPAPVRPRAKPRSEQPKEKPKGFTAESTFDKPLASPQRKSWAE